MLIHYQADDTVRMGRWELNYENLKKRLPKIRKKRMCNGILLIRLNTIVLGSQILESYVTIFLLFGLLLPIQFVSIATYKM